MFIQIAQIRSDFFLKNLNIGANIPTTQIMLWPLTIELHQINAKTYAFHSRSFDHTHKICVCIQNGIQYRYLQNKSRCMFLIETFVFSRLDGFKAMQNIWTTHKNNNMVMVIFEHFYQSLKRENLNFFTLQNGINEIPTKAKDVHCTWTMNTNVIPPEVNLHSYVN